MIFTFCVFAIAKIKIEYCGVLGQKQGFKGKHFKHYKKLGLYKKNWQAGKERMGGDCGDLGLKTRMFVFWYEH